MTIHSIYGVCWNIYDSSENFIRRYEDVYSKPMNSKQIKEVVEEYNKLTAEEKRYAKIRFFTYCSEKYVNGSRNFM